MNQTLPRRGHRRLLALLAAAAVALIAWGILRAALPAAGIAVPGIVPAHGDYRDPVQLAQAMKEKDHSDTASCAKNAYTGKYMCFVFFAGGASGSYTVTVSADGKSFAAS